MPNSLPTLIKRRTFLQTSASAFAAGLIADVLGLTHLMAQVCPVIAPGDTVVPEAYSNHPGLLALRADVLLQQLVRGNSYYGLSPNWTTLWSVNQLMQSVQMSLTDMQSVYNDLAALTCNLDVSLLQASTYAKVQTKIAGLQTTFRNNIDSYNTQATELIVVIGALKVQIDSARQRVDKAQANFDDAVLNADNPCGFAQVLGIVVAVVAVVAAVFTAGSSLVAAYGAIGSLAATGLTAVSVGAEGISLFNELKTDYEKVKPLVTKVENAVSTAVNDVSDLVQKYNKLQALTNVDADCKRVVIEQTSFQNVSDDRLNQFRASVNGAAAVPQAIRDELISAVQLYFDLVQLRNKRINDHDGLIFAIQDSARQYFELGIQNKVISDLQSQVQNSLVSEAVYVDALTNVQNTQLAIMQRRVWDEKRALAFWQLDPGVIANQSLAQFHNNTRSLTPLMQAHADIVIKFGSLAANGTPFDRTPFNPPVRVTIRLTDAQRASLLLNRQFHFVTKQSDFPTAMREIFVTAFKFTMNPISPEFRGQIYHLGHHEFQTVNRGLVEFTSVPVKKSFQTGNMPHFTDIRNLDSGASITGVSAMGNWLISADDDVPAEVLSSLQSIIIAFEGNYRHA